jgi:hypothetical protein
LLITGKFWHIQTNKHHNKEQWLTGEEYNGRTAGSFLCNQSPLFKLNVWMYKYYLIISLWITVFRYNVINKQQTVCSFYIILYVQYNVTLIWKRQNLVFIYHLLNASQTTIIMYCNVLFFGL